MDLTFSACSLPLTSPFKIARMTYEAAQIVDVLVSHQGILGRGQGIPQPRFGDTLDVALEQLQHIASLVTNRVQLQSLLPPGAARNAVDAALWDLDAKMSGIPAWATAELSKPEPIPTAYTISLVAPEDAFEQARLKNGHRLIKVKLGRPDDVERLMAIREAAPRSRLIADVNEAWDLTRLREMAPHLVDCGVELVEQPLPESDDSKLYASEFPFHICADESFHSEDALSRLGDRYDFINIKLDKLGGLTQALIVAKQAKSRNIGVMVGCGVGSSLSLAPALLLAQLAEYADLDGPLFLKQDIEPGLVYTSDTVSFPSPSLWG